ncbi:MAG: Surface layer protein precursor [Firmicutes bacterium ADurb.Bin193]|nr:MAG: Surface layer protein precursor [Firmicutes bacterium ADurb.Bin193]
MSRFKRISAIAIACTMVFGLLTSFVSASPLPADVVGTKYEEPVELLRALDIMVGDAETGAFRLQDGILRSEFAKIAVYLAGLAEVAESSMGTTKFPDVVEGHWATGFINVAAQQGYVIGDDVGTFRPDDKITYAEAITVIVRILGYEPSAMSAGGFPTGYTVVAGQIGLLKNGVVSTGSDVATTRGTVAIMAANSLTINMMEKTSFGVNETYEVVDKQILTEKLDVTKNYGQITANYVSSLTGPSSLREDEVNILGDNGETVTYKTGKTNAADFLARNVIYYVKDNGENEDPELILVRNNANKNDELKVPAANIKVLTGDADEDKTLEYWENKDTDKNAKKATITADAKVFYNGVATSDYDLSNLNDLESGSVTLLDTTRTDEYNYVFVTEYRNLVVDEVSLVSHRVNDKYNLLSLTLDPEDKSVKFSITKNGEKIGLADLKEWDVLSVAMDNANPAEATVINVVVSDKAVVGKVEEIDGEKRMIGGALYEIAKNYIDANQPEIYLDDEGTFYLDIEGRIAAVDTKTVVGSNYAYLVDAEMAGTINKTLEFKLFNQLGETKIFKAASKVKVNNTSSLTGEQALEMIKGEGNDEVTPQLITFETNSAGEITLINTAMDNGTGLPVKNTFSRDYASDSLEYKSASKKLGNFNVNSGTIVFDIPEGETDTDNFAVRTMDMFVDKTSYSVEIYDLSEDLTAKIILVKDSTGETNAESAIAVVSKVSSAQNADRVTVDKLYALENGTTIELLAQDTATLVREDGTKLSAGDIIQYKKNVRGEIEKVTVLFDSRDRANDDIEIYKAYEGTEMETVIGTVSKKFTNSINVVTSNMAETNYNIENAKVYSYDYTKPSSSQVTVVDSSYITKYDEGDARKVFLRIYKGEVVEIVIIKE